MKRFFKVTKIVSGLYRVSDESGREIGKIHKGPDDKHDFVPTNNLAFGEAALLALSACVKKLDLKNADTV